MTNAPAPILHAPVHPIGPLKVAMEKLRTDYETAARLMLRVILEKAARPDADHRALVSEFDALWIDFTEHKRRHVAELLREQAASP